MHPKRRSGRIAKELPIILLGTDTAGKVFAEQTKTVVLSRHGAGVISKYRFAPDEVLTLRLAGSSKEAEVRLVGQIGGEPGRYIHGLAFVDTQLNFWPMEFPPAEHFEPAKRQLTLECTSCQNRQTVAHSEIEEDVYSVNGNVLRFCPSCGTTTSWTKTGSEAKTEESSAPSREEHANSEHSELSHRSDVPPAPSNGDSPSSNGFPASTAASPGSGHSTREGSRPTRAFESAFASTPANAYSSAALETMPTATAEPPVPEASGPQGGAAPESSASAARTDQSGRPADSQGRPVNRRRHMRVRVNFSGCVRESLGAPDIVECANMSKGGLCFHSRKQYPIGTIIEIAAPFSPGAPAIFVPAKIKRVEPIGDGHFFRYGVAYIESKD